VTVIAVAAAATISVLSVLSVAKTVAVAMLQTNFVAPEPPLGPEPVEGWSWP